MFETARIKLTLWYLLIIVLISGTLSAIFYIRVSHIIELEYTRIERRLQRDENMMSFGRNAKLTQTFLAPEDLEHARQKIIEQLLFVNAGIVIVFTIAGYFLSGKTLAPIQRSMNEQKRFIGDAAHELKTPIAALKTSLEVNLMDKSLDTKTKHILQENLEDVSSLESLTESLLKLARINDTKLQYEAVSAFEVIHQAIKHIQPLATKKHIGMTINTIPKSVYFLGDKGALTDLFLIFLDNAVKYSPKTSAVTVRFSSTNKNVKVRIQDEGIGIAKHHQEHIFDRFYRVDSARSKSQSDGFGLGLSVAKKIVDQHNGKVEIKSELKKGTTFIITLPRIKHELGSA